MKLRVNQRNWLLSLTLQPEDCGLGQHYVLLLWR